MGPWARGSGRESPARGCGCGHGGSGRGAAGAAHPARAGAHRPCARRPLRRCGLHRAARRRPHPAPGQVHVAVVDHGLQDGSTEQATALVDGLVAARRPRDRARGDPCGPGGHRGRRPPGPLRRPAYRPPPPQVARPPRSHPRRPGRDRAARAGPRLGFPLVAGHGHVGPAVAASAARAAPQGDPRRMRGAGPALLGRPAQRRPPLHPRSSSPRGVAAARGRPRRRRRRGARPHRRPAARRWGGPRRRRRRPPREGQGRRPHGSGHGVARRPAGPRACCGPPPRAALVAGRCRGRRPQRRPPAGRGRSRGPLARAGRRCTPAAVGPRSRAWQASTAHGVVAGRRIRDVP